ncbi:hypothetical protein [Paenibacillus polymyxa]|uniref:hypothetical protein n=1 Tax=Paenibacillus polymyxa TaxID=1406 RepID=UPI0005ED37C7|nr:hypothetical protein [Paenibacillus polymyxa]
MTTQITAEDHALVRTYLLLPMVLTAFERDKRILSESAGLRTPGPYVEVVERAMNAVSAELKDIRASMRKRGVKVYEQTRDSVQVVALYQCRGYHGRFMMLNSFVAAEAGLLMRKYLGLDTRKVNAARNTLRP